MLSNILISWGLVTPSVTALSDNMVQNNNILVLQVSPIFPKNGMILKDFPTSLKVQVTRGGFPVEGAIVQFWFGEHNAFLTKSDSSGFAYLTLLSQNTLPSGYYSWHATAIKTGFRGGSTLSNYFIISSNDNNNLSSGGTVSTDKKNYFIGNGKIVDVKISGNVNSYYLGDAIILKIISPSKTIQLVARGTYLGAFQTTYNLGDNSEVGFYTVTAFYKYNVFSTATFTVIKSSP